MDHLELLAAQHPDPHVRRLGFDLTHPYVEQCWGALLGPSSVVVLRRLPVLWADQEPAQVPTDELARSLGLGAGTGHNSRLHRTLDRLTRFRLAIWTEPDRALGIYTDVPPLDARHLSRVTTSTQQAHDRLLSRHLDELARSPSIGRCTAVDRLLGSGLDASSPTSGLDASSPTSGLER
jgi:hypothetical protein